MVRVQFGGRFLPIKNDRSAKTGPAQRRRRGGECRPLLLRSTIGQIRRARERERWRTPERGAIKFRRFRADLLRSVRNSEVARRVLINYTCKDETEKAS